jgi:cell wall-associated NlpC family hydrolase
MMSLVSGLSVNLIALLAGTVGAPVDSARVVATASGPVVARSTNNVGAPGAATLERGIVKTASRYLGTRYRFGGTKPGAFDCSGFVRYVFGRHGIALPRTATDQSAVGHPIVVGLDSVAVGDLLFFATKRGRSTHVAIYLGDGRIIHASAGSRRVRYDDLSSPRGRWFIEHLSSVRRVVVQQVALNNEPQGPKSAGQ